MTHVFLPHLIPYFTLPCYPPALAQYIRQTLVFRTKLNMAPEFKTDMSV